MKQNKFPLIFGRQGGASIAILDVFKTDKTFNLIESVFDHEKQQQEIKNKLLAVLETVIGNEKEDKSKSQLINLKRDFFNDRNTSKYMPLLQNYTDLKKGFETYTSQYEIFENHKNDYFQMFNQEFYKSIESLNEITDSFFIKNGLLFSSKTVYDEINKTNFKYTSLNKKEKHLIVSVLKYLTRSVLKTTPFSSLNSIFCLEQKGSAYTSIGDTFKTSNFQTTNLFFYYLKEAIIENKSFKNCLKIKPNDNCWKNNRNQENAQLFFFVNNKNNETFKKIQDSEVLQYLINELKEGKHLYRDLIKKLHAETGQDVPILEGYIDKLSEEGFLIVKYPVSCDDKNWIQSLILFLKKNHKSLDKEFTEIINALYRILECIARLESTFDVAERDAIIMEEYQKVLAVLIKWNPDTEFPGKVIPQDFFYEDTLINKNIALKSKDVETLLELLKEAYSAINCINSKAAMKKELVKKMTRLNIKQMPVLRFYENIFLPFHEQFNSGFIDLESFKNKFQELMKSINANEILIDKAIDVSQFFKIKNVKTPEDIPFGAYIQSVDASMDQIVVNAFYNAYGANVSRFLNFIPERFAKQVAAFNEERLSGKIIAEIKDAAIHNVNTYPQLAKNIISTNQDNEYANSVATIPLTDIFVKINNKNDLILVNSEGVEVKAINFSLEGLKRKSKFVQFLDTFNSVDNFGFAALLDNFNKYFQSKLEDQPIVFIPRLVFKETIVLQRKMWLVKKIWFEKILNSGKSYPEIYMTLLQMIQQAGFPFEVFIKVSQRGTKGVKDNYKPQYIDFKSPVFLLLLINAVNQAVEVVEISEVFPQTSAVRKEDGFVKEYLLNL